MINSGDRYGRWTVIGPSDKPYYFKCKCECGTVKDVYKSSLIHGKSASCGCLQRDLNQKKGYEKSDVQIIGKKFGRLTPIERINNKGSARYKCKCDCGKLVTATGSQLLSGKAKSCGCLKSEVSKKNFEKVRDQGYRALEKTKVDGTSLVALDQKLSKNSKTGVKGVSYIEKTGKYRAYINLRRKQIHLGHFDTIEEAKEARKEAEKKYFDPIKKIGGKNGKRK